MKLGVRGQKTFRANKKKGLRKKKVNREMVEKSGKNGKKPIYTNENCVCFIGVA
jgi:hypothetical protein